MMKYMKTRSLILLAAIAAMATPSRADKHEVPSNMKRFKEFEPEQFVPPKVNRPNTNSKAQRRKQARGR